MKQGDIVTLRAYGDREIIRRVVGLEGDVVLVCREEEYIAAEREGREPVVVGFPATVIVREGAATTS
jgi:hypothetical protein